MRTGIENWLKALPPVEPPPALSARVRAAQRRESHRLRRARGVRAGAGFALAAGVALAAVMLLQEPAIDPGRAEPSSALRVQALALEAALERFDHESRVLDMRTADTIIRLEDSIAAVDWNLRTAELDPDRRAQLWEQRIGLMQALVGVHVAETAELEF